MELRAIREKLYVHDSDISDSQFSNAKRIQSSFRDVNPRQSTFSDASLADVSFANVNFTDTSITDSDLTGMKINGFLVADLLKAYQIRSK
jgi:uncharacterized protein YjbI with pentapeptide repeats